MTRADDGETDPVQSTGQEDVQNVSSVEEIPSGYEVKRESGEDGEVYYVNVFTGVAWYTAKDKFGRTYYYEENGNESCWTLPSVSQTSRSLSQPESSARKVFKRVGKTDSFCPQ